MGVGIGYVDGPRFRRSVLAAADWVAAGRDELNRLNVFPVPDGDTGTNMCLTLRSVLLDRSIQTGGSDATRRLRLGVVHGDVPQFAEALRAELVARCQPKREDGTNA
ncbi:MAG TPA: hypothetical protein VGJ83_02095 [Gemmatimonadales bacterium]